MLWVILCAAQQQQLGLATLTCWRPLPAWLFGDLVSWLLSIKSALPLRWSTHYSWALLARWRSQRAWLLALVDVIPLLRSCRTGIVRGEMPNPRLSARLRIWNVEQNAISPRRVGPMTRFVTLKMALDVSQPNA